MLSHLVESSSIDIKVRSIVSIHRFRDVEAVVQHEDIDLVMLVKTACSGFFFLSSNLSITFLLMF
jgi:hypothetical protein